MLPGAVEGLFSDSLHPLHDVALVLGAGGGVAAHLGQEHLGGQQHRGEPTALQP